jgi:3-dehydrotetronate 4-kinase
VVQALDVKRMLIGPQIAPGVPWTTVSSSVCNGETVHIALKSGNFGGPDFFAKSFSLLKSA